MYLLYVVEISFESPLRTLQISHTMVVVVLTSVINIVVDVVSNVVVDFAVVVDLVVNVDNQPRQLNSVVILGSTSSC